MYSLRIGTRMIQNRQNICNSTFTLYNTQLDEEAEIGKYAAKLIRKAYRSGDFSFMKRNEYTNYFLEQLIDMGFIYEKELNKEEKETIYLGQCVKHNYPLTALNIELTNICNLHCKHCYGSFSETMQSKFVPFEWIKESIEDMNSLHVRKVALTGGEATIHPKFIDIALFLMQKGFEVCIFTNGYNNAIIEDLLKVGKNYNFTIKVSLDGLKNIHNSIRGKKDAYTRTLKAIELISTYKNVKLYISTTILRENIDEIPELSEEIKKRFPNAIHTKDLAFPLGNADDCTFTINELEQVDKQIPDLFMNRESDIDLQKGRRKIKYLRCTGGVSQCTLMPDGRLKICNAACDDQFYFKYNAYSKGLKYAWLNCGSLIKKFRSEDPKITNDCKKCSLVKKCRGSDCRVMAWVYTGNASRSNPITCFTTKKMENILSIRGMNDSLIKK